VTTRPGKYGNMFNAELFNKIFSGTTVLVTGHTGFMGAWLSLWLISLGANVIGYSQRTIDNQDIFNAVSLEDKITDINGDVNNAVDLQECIITNKPKFVFSSCRSTSCSNLLRGTCRNFSNKYHGNNKST